MTGERNIPDPSNGTDALATIGITGRTDTTAAETEKTMDPSGPSKTVPRPPYSALKPRQRRLFLGIVATAGLFGPLAAGVYLPALPTLQAAFHTSATAINATVSVFMAVLAVGPLFWASHADYAGRKPLYIISLSIYIAANVLLAALPANLAALFILRIVQAFGAASVLSLGAGTVADLVEPKNRASAMSVVLLGPQLGPVLGPLLGGALTGAASWRWIFGFLAITCAATLLVLIVSLPETLRSIVGNGVIHADKGLFIRPKWRQERVVDPSKFPKPPAPTLIGLLKLLQHAPVLVVSFNNALLFAAYYAMTVTLSRVLQDEYGFSATETGLAYLAPGLALVAGSMISGRVSDLHLRMYTRRNPDAAPNPERRLQLQIPGIMLSITGVLLYGWFCDFHIHVVGVIVANAIAAFGMTWVFITTTAYLTESTPTNPATLVALAGLFRNPAAAIAAVVVEPLVGDVRDGSQGSGRRRGSGPMGPGWCFTGLALLELACIASSAWLMLRKRRAAGKN